MDKVYLYQLRPYIRTIAADMVKYGYEEIMYEDTQAIRIRYSDGSEIIHKLYCYHPIAIRLAHFFYEQQITKPISNKLRSNTG